jgi:hypothetical protein
MTNEIRYTTFQNKPLEKEYKGIKYGITCDQYVVSRQRIGRNKDNYFFNEKDFMAAVDLMIKRAAEV